jgi:hypothetical protein
MDIGAFTDWFIFLLQKISSLHIHDCADVYAYDIVGCRPVVKQRQKIRDNRQRPIHRNSSVFCAVRAEMIEAGQVSERGRDRIPPP